MAPSGDIGLCHRFVDSPADSANNAVDDLEQVPVVPEFDGGLLQYARAFGDVRGMVFLEIMNLFREINARGTTVLVATHDRELIRRVGRRSISLDHGRIAETVS